MISVPMKRVLDIAHEHEKKLSAYDFHSDYWVMVYHEDGSNSFIETHS